MGLRFRRSVKIVPGLRLNFSTGGISATIGPRGASVNLGSRGAFLNLGLPGTGLSYRSQLVGGGPSSNQSSDVPLYLSSRTVTKRERQEQEREARQQQAQEQYSEREAELRSLRDILRGRSRDAVDWVEEYGSKGPYERRPFVPPPDTVDPEQTRKEVFQLNSLRPWVLASLAALACGLLAPQLWIRIPASLLALYFGIESFRLSRRRPQSAAELVKARQAYHSREVEVARNKHEREESERAQLHDKEEALRTRIREAVVTDDADILVNVLEVELSNEDLPLPVNFDIEFEGVRRVQLEVELPTIEVIPSTVSSLTKTGKLSERKMAQRDRFDLYKDVCAGLMLRLMHEVFRVLPFVEQVGLRGIRPAPDPATGRASRYVVVRLAADRNTFLNLALDDVDPSQALAYLGGQMTVARDGTLQPQETSVDE